MSMLFLFFFKFSVLCAGLTHVSAKDESFKCIQEKDSLKFLAPNIIGYGQPAARRRI